MPTERGLSVFDTITKKYTHYFEEDGLQKFSRFNEILKTKNGDIWIGGEHGLNQITPSKLANKDPTKPAVFITGMRIMDSIYSAADGNLFKKAVSYTDQVKLKHWQKDLSFNFVGLHYLKPEDNQYSWQLENYDNHWSTPSKVRNVAYTNLSPGTYTFRVKASNADGIWNEEGASIKIIIAPPWWQTWWANLFYVLLIGFIGLQIHKSQREKTLRLARERAQKKELEQAKEIEKAYNELQNTQEQLIQSEKMASLGELTAGIAHEIQNPLNFVNNFSEVNSELIEEMKEELDSGNLEEVKSLADDINENEKKIMFHGKRADSIVKGMLQHSRASGDKKEPTDINTLADEYMRLAYHGLRAKDKSFNATLETNFDDTIGKINVIPQDIGRVILNLFTNAFYAVSEKKAQLKKTDPSNTYKPTVSVTTKKTNQNVQIVVEDNGDGIPQKVIKKIFEPFFTTKPTGKGTGLGLSMSYDIIKTHGGSLDVKSEKGVHTQFKIILPINQD
jgi:signal transduction histidine kinase